MAINPNLLVIKPVNELESVTGLQAGELLFYDGSNNLKKIDIDTFNNLSKTAKPLKPTDPTPTDEGLYMPTESGTYTNADGLIAQEGYYTLFFFDGTNWTKSEIKLPEGDSTDEIDKTLRYFLNQPTGVENLDLDYNIQDSGNPDIYGKPIQNEKILKTDNTLLDYFEPGYLFMASKDIPLVFSDGRITKIEATVKVLANTSGSTNSNMVGVKEDGTIVPLINYQGTPPTTLQNYTFDVSEYISVSLGFLMVGGDPSSANQHIKFYKKGFGAVEDGVKTYIDEKAGSSISIQDTFIFAETAGVKASNSPALNSALINQLIDARKEYGGTIILPIGKLKYGSSIELWNTVSLKGALRGRNYSMGGTSLESTINNKAIIIKNFNNNDCAQTISDMQLNGANIGSNGISIESGMAFFTLENMEVAGYTINCIETIGALIYTMRNIRITGAPKGLVIKSKTTNPVFDANHIRLEMCQFANITGIGTDIDGGANINFEQCDWEQNGTVGNTNTGNVRLRNMCQNGEFINASFNQCWSEYVNGGFWLDQQNCAGVTVFRDCMPWRHPSSAATGDAQKGIINNGSRLLIDNSRLNDFPVDIETSNGGETRIQGFSQIANHTESAGGTYKSVTYS